MGNYQYVWNFKSFVCDDKTSSPDQQSINDHHSFLFLLIIS